MIKLIPFCYLFLLINCTNEIKKTESVQLQLAKTLKQAVMNYNFDLKENDAPHLSGFEYYKFINRQAIKNSFSLTDSIKVENFWLLFYKFSINGHDYFQADWYINIKGAYFYAGLYISEYNVEELFDKEDIDLAKALIKKADTWENKSEKRWWKFID
jgi:hypothetical protein